MVAWVDVQDVKDFMGDAGPQMDDGLTLALAAAVSYVETDAASPKRRADLWTDVGDPPVATFAPTPEIQLGPVMLAARWFTRRNSLTGTTTGYGDFGTGTILRYDPDIARLLRIGSEAPFGFGAPSLVTDPGVVVL